MPFVLDNSVAMAWCFEDEASPFTDGVLEQLRGTSAFVPAIWPFEVANVLLVAERRSRVAETKVRDFVKELERLPITVEGVGLERTFHEVLDLAREQGLTTYDAAYLELAVRDGLPLATLDRELREAAMRVGVPLVQ